MQYLKKTEYVEAAKVKPKVLSSFRRHEDGRIDSNSLPKEWRSISVAEYISKLHSAVPPYTGYAQFFYDHERKELPVSIFANLSLYEDGTGVAWSPLVEGARIVGANYYAWGCNHKWKELSAEDCKLKGLQHWGMCWHVYECVHCGEHRSEDSSG